MNINPFNNNSLSLSPKKLIQVSDMSEYPTFISSKTKKHRVREEELNENAFGGNQSLRKIWIPSTCISIQARTPQYSPFYGCSPYLVIYTDVREDEIPEGWWPYWNYYSDSETLPVFYGASLLQYELASTD